MNWEKEGWCCFSKITKPHVPGLLSFQRNAVAKNNSPMIMSRRFGSKAINLGNEADHQLTREFLMKKMMGVVRRGKRTLKPPPISQSVSEFLEPESLQEAKVAPLLSRSNLLITRDIEWANLVLGFEQENLYAIVDVCYPQSPVGFIREERNILARQSI